MRIYHICNAANEANGILSVLKPLSVEQQNLGHKVKIINTYSDNIIGNNIDYYNAKQFEQLIRSAKPDVVLFHGLFYQSVITFAHILIKQNIPYFIELHGAMSFQNMNKSRIKKIIANKLFFNNIIRQANGIIYLNYAEYAKSSILDLNPSSIIIPNGTDRLIIPEIKINRKLNEKIEILSIGRIDVSHKGLDVLIDGIQELKNKNIEGYHFSFYGIGSENDLRWFNENINRIENQCDFYGPVYGENKESVYNQSDILILTSRYEGFPMVILEALSRGIPCIITPQTNVADIIEKYDCGWVTTHDAKEISETIMAAIEDFKNRRQELIKNSILAAGLFQWKEIAKQSIERYRKYL